MPLFDYQCVDCDRIYYDRLVKHPDSQQICECGQPLRKLPSSPAMHPKGAGTHRSDYNAPTSGRRG